MKRGSPRGQDRVEELIRFSLHLYYTLPQSDITSITRIPDKEEEVVYMFSQYIEDPSIVAELHKYSVLIIHARPSPPSPAPLPAILIFFFFAMDPVHHKVHSLRSMEEENLGIRPLFLVQYFSSYTRIYLQWLFPRLRRGH